MTVGLKDGLKLAGVAIVCFCAVFVCTFMLNFYLDVAPLRDTVSEEAIALYEAQLATAKFCSAITGGVLSLTAAVMLLFYLRLYIDAHAAQLGVLKALVYSRFQICRGFWVFGLSVFLGCAAGFGGGWAAMRYIYDSLLIEGMGAIAPRFHTELLFALVAAPSVLFSALACVYPYFVLRRPPLELIRANGKKQKKEKPLPNSKKDRPFLREMCLASLKSKKLLVFFAAFSCFCFAAMTQMGLSMNELTDTGAVMSYMILAIGLVLAAVTAILCVAALLRANRKNIALMKAFGYSLKQCVLCVLGGYLPFAILGFALGTVYQYGLLMLMINVVFAGVESIPSYSFNVPVFFMTLAAFLLSYALLTTLFARKIGKVPVKEIMLEE